MARCRDQLETEKTRMVMVNILGQMSRGAAVGRLVTANSFKKRRKLRLCPFQPRRERAQRAE